MRIIRENDVRALVTMDDALSAVEQSLCEQANGTGMNQPRQRIHQSSGILHMLGGALTERGYWGFKAYTSTRQGTRFSVTLYDIRTGAMLALIEADYLGQLRTGAASGVATRHLARQNSTTLALFGAGYQAETQLEAIAAVRPLQDIRVYSRSNEHRTAFARRMSQRTGLNVRAVSSPGEALADADIITTITTAREPVFGGGDIAPGAHINAAGANSLLRMELDHTTIRRADLVFVDDLAQARIESRDLIMAAERNAFFWEQARLLAQVITGMTVGRSDDQEITLFESQGIALWDIALAATVYERAEAQQVGTLVEFGA